VELPEGSSSALLFDKALRRSIRIAPGSMFSNSDRYDRFVRFGCTLAFTDEVEEAYRTLGELLRQ
jgi:DNA-binding transcriptional MocR family regulator